MAWATAPLRSASGLLLRRAWLPLFAGAAISAGALASCGTQHAGGALSGQRPARALGAMRRISGCVADHGYPDRACTPGAVDPRVTQRNLAGTICQRGYTRGVRPPLRLTEPIKRERLAAYGFAGQPLRQFELDHLVALEIGGAPTSLANLWPEQRHGPDGASAKDRVERAARAAVCAGSIGVTEVQRAMARDWKALGARLGVRR